MNGSAFQKFSFPGQILLSLKSEGEVRVASGTHSAPSPAPLWTLPQAPWMDEITLKY